jgi:hypothetical protein
MFKRLLSIFFSLSIISFSNAQDEVLKNTDVKALEQMSKDFTEGYLALQPKIEAYAKANNLLVHHILPNGKVVSIVGFEANGKPMYRQTENLGAGITVSNHRVYPNVNIANNYNLTGRGFRIGEWDGGTNRITHSEYQGRAIQADNGTMPLSEHATHVGGTIIAGGVNVNAKGMAYQANLLANDWVNDDGEMSIRASQGLLISNHSYGTPAGWDDEGNWNGDNAVHPTIDYKFGFYTQDAKDWDAIAQKAPYYLIVKSAGNSRNQSGSNPLYPRNGFPDGYDCIPTYSVAKNILTVGAVEKVANGYSNPAGVVMSSFSSWGPADDGRIKPDICGAGVGIRSAGIASDAEYKILQGTSMSGPSIAGSCLLLIEQYSNTHNEKKMRSSTLKGLVIHTADECWNFPGPDYRYGWGLMNTKKAADLIAADSITSLLQENVLTNQAVKEITVTAEGNGKPLIATLCWTDVPGNPISPAYNSRTRMLVNDLDLRIINESNQVVSLPWKLDPESPASAATRADNIVDNVEKVEISGVSAGQTYKIRVSHKGNLFTNSTTPQTQAYSLIVSGIIAGDTAATCRPMHIFNASAGRFDDGSGPNKNYFSNADCKWMINAGDTNSIVQLIFRNFNVGSGDTLYAYSRYATGDTLIKKFFGTVTNDTIYSVSDKLILNFRSDNTGSGPGWEVNFGSLPKPRFDFRAASVNVCSGATTAMSVQPLNGPTSDWTYSWSVSGGGFTISNPLVSNPTITFSSVGLFAITLSVTNKSGTTTITKTNYVNVRPAVSLVQTPYQEGFEISTFPNYPAEPQKNWSITPDALTWTKNTVAPYEGNVAMRIRNNPTSPVIRELIGPGIDLTPIMANGPQLSFRMAYARRISTASTDQLRVLASTDCGQTWNPILTRSNTSSPTLATTVQLFTNDYIPDLNDYRLEKVSLSNFSTGISNFLFKFEMRSDKGNNLFLDNVVVEGTVSNRSLDKLNSIKVDLFPNPTNESSTILISNPQGKDIKVDLLDLLGRKINQNDLGGSDSEISLETKNVFGEIQKGIYLINVKSDLGSQTLKWIKQ